MMEDLIGKTFNRLTVLEFAGRDKHKSRIWNCACECGGTATASTNSLKRGNTKSCGCLQKEKAAKSGKKFLTVHGLSKHPNGKKTRLFRIWTGIKTRCLNPNDHAFPRYGGRGILLCKEWMDFAVFHEWAINNGYKDNLTIERVDLNGNYEAANCKWITKGDQANNRKSSRFISFENNQYTLSQLARKHSISVPLLHARLSRGWTIEDAVKEPNFKSKNINH